MSALPYREIIELRSVGLSFEKVAFLCGCSATKASAVSRRAAELGLGWPVPVELSDDELARLVDSHDAARCNPVDLEDIQGRAGRRLDAGDVEEAYAAYVDLSVDRPPYVFATFCERFVQLVKARARGAKMLVNWHPGEEVQVDWAGRKLSLYGAGEEVTPVSLFVATLPYSDKTFVRASLEMGMQSWLEHHKAMFAYFGGAPLFVAPDNLATGVVFDEDRERSIHPRYQELADHYGAMVLPARVRTPTDKAAVESHVRIMANSIAGVLEQMRFTSLGQLNLAIAELLEVYNDRPVVAFKGRSRNEIFESEERECLQPLPETEFAPVTWRKVDVSFDGVVRVRGNFYGVPPRYAERKVAVRIAEDAIEIYTADRRQCIARHPRREDGAETFEGLPGVHPDRFKPLDVWCEEHRRTRILEQWDYDANGGKGPHDCVCRSGRPVHWRCPDCGFKWVEAPARRTGRSFDDCLACADVALIPGKNDLATVRPDIAEEWHPTRNPLPASAVFPDFKQQVWWLGRCGHEWRAPIAKRVNSRDGALCPYCSGRKALKGFNDVATLCPELAALWHPVKNRNLTPDAVSIASHREVYLWDGVMTRIWRQNPRKWLEEHGRAELLASFDSLVEEARVLDAADGRVGYGIGHGKSSVKWSRFLREAELNVSFEEWCLRFGHADLLAQWDEERNGPLKPSDVSRCDSARVWWRGECGHSWQLSVRTRAFNDAGCPYCGRRLTLEGFNSAECLDAGILHLWHPAKNGDLRPSQVSDRTAKRIWLQCPTCGYEWRESLRGTRKESRKCPSCHGGRGHYLAKGSNDLGSKRPDVARQLDPELNGGLRAEDLHAHAGAMVWWRGSCGHVWREKVIMRSMRVDDSCPYCKNRKLLRGFNDLATTHPELVAEWDFERNGDLGPDGVKFNATKQVWWRGSCGHEWRMSPRQRAAEGLGCPYCSGHRVLAGFNDLASQHPELLAEWDWERNGDLGPDGIVSGSARRVWWRCGRGHAWQISAYNRTGGADRGCPYCGDRKVLKGYNDLRTTHPKIAREWNKERNGDLKPTDVIANSNKRVWWKCREGHEWSGLIANRARRGKADPGCPYCAGRKVLAGYNDLATTHPGIAAMWHPRMNKRLKPAGVQAISRKLVWWRGECGHVYQMAVRDRVRAKPGYCPYCSGRKRPVRPIRLD